jgi:glucose-1-phosphate adenylyltransferase
MSKKDCIAMLLAGGEGRRLSPLTNNLAKPAVPFGGEYRIIDFPLSNCANSEIYTVGVLTQYESESLHTHIGGGEPWGLNGSNREGVSLLSPSKEDTSGYLGTADAVYKNMSFIDEHDPDHVLILSGDHIYSMDYRTILEAHKSSGADATLSVMEVPWSEAHRFGIMEVNRSMRVVDFAEKPTKPQSNLASMGIYVFKWAYLREKLMEDSRNPKSSHDFGKDVLPRMLRLEGKLFAYPFEGYWRDVGTVKSLWEAHMDLLEQGAEPQLEPAPNAWPTYSRQQYEEGGRSPISRTDDHDSSLSHWNSAVLGDVQRTVIFYGVQVAVDSVVQDSVLMPNVKIGRRVRISHAIIGEGAIIKDGAVIEGRKDKIEVIAPHAVVEGRPLAPAAHSRMDMGKTLYDPHASSSTHLGENTIRSSH